jgi:hypothetical protein
MRSLSPNVTALARCGGRNTIQACSIAPADIPIGQRSHQARVGTMDRKQGTCPRLE